MTSERTDDSTSSASDDGSTLPEVLITVMVLGTIVAVLSTSLVSVFRQEDNTEGRFNVSRAEQTVGMWVPADLASAVTVDIDAASTPCGDRPAPDVVPPTCPAGIDLSGSNAMLLSWTSAEFGATVTTNVAYHFSTADDGLFQLTRIECSSAGGPWECSTIVVLHDLPGPPGGESFVPGVTSPTWVILVSEPLAPDAVEEGQLAEPTSELKNAKRVVVTINGGGDRNGAGGGVNQISLTAGGTTRSMLSADSVQGAPSFSQARSRCGGPVALVIDESNSIGSAIGEVEAGVTEFVQALAGTPVKLQVVRFHTFSSILGDSSAWHRYFDMTNEADVAALLGAINQLQGSWSSSPNGGTNWEEGWFRTFSNPDGSTAAIIPDTVVFFTDGVPTFDRLVHHSAPGVIPAEPPAPGQPWPQSQGNAYSQVAFNRANYIATMFRSSVRLIGVGVGAGITGDSTWISDPGAGYREIWERGSWAHEKQTWTYEARYQIRNTTSSPYYYVVKSIYDVTPSNRRRNVGWTDIPESLYNQLESPPNTSDNDGVRRTSIWAPITTADYTAFNTTGDSSDGYRVRSGGKTYTSPYLDWELWPGSRSSGSSSSYRMTKVYNSPPFDGYDPAVTAETDNDVILARLIAGNDNGVSAIWNGSTYTNAEEADLYILPAWSQFKTALKAVALGECGGTLTLQTRIGGTTPAPDPFTYQNTGVTDSSGTELEIEPTVVRTNQQFTTGTFDFSIPSGQFVTVDIQPENLSDLGAYTPGSWSCKAGINNRTFTPITLTGTPWPGIRVQVGANEAVSCTLSVNSG